MKNKTLPFLSVMFLVGMVIATKSGYVGLAYNQSTQCSGARYADALKVHTDMACEVLKTSLRVIDSSSAIRQGRLNKSVLKNMLQTAFAEERLDVEAAVDLDMLLQNNSISE